MATTTLPVLRHVSSDDALARRIADGDEIAFSVLYQRYRTRIERYIRSIVRHDEDALDAAQNTLVKALIAIRAGRQAPTSCRGCSTSPATRRSPCCAGAARSP